MQWMQENLQFSQIIFDSTNFSHSGHKLTQTPWLAGFEKDLIQPEPKKSAL